MQNYLTGNDPHAATNRNRKKPLLPSFYTHGYRLFAREEPEHHHNNKQQQAATKTTTTETERERQTYNQSTTTHTKKRKAQTHSRKQTTAAEDPNTRRKPTHPPTHQIPSTTKQNEIAVPKKIA